MEEGEAFSSPMIRSVFWWACAMDCELQECFPSHFPALGWTRWLKGAGADFCLALLKSVVRMGKIWVSHTVAKGKWNVIGTSENSLAFLKMLKDMQLPYDLNNSIPRYLHKRIENIYMQTCTQMPISSIIKKSCKWKTTQVYQLNE